MSDGDEAGRRADAALDAEARAAERRVGRFVPVPDDEPRAYVLAPYVPPPAGGMATASYACCAVCGRGLHHRGGPGGGALCRWCVRVILADHDVRELVASESRRAWRAEHE